MRAVQSMFFLVLSWATSYADSKNKTDDPEFLGCNFDNETFCEWNNGRIENSQHFNWTLRRGRTPSIDTGPEKDFSGLGWYAYIEASVPRKKGDTARLLSPVLPSKSLCMTFMYHMYGNEMGSLIVYVITNVTEKVTWVKTGNRGNAWLKAIVQLNETDQCKVSIEAIRGSSYSSDIAIDEIKFVEGICNETSTQILHVYVKDSGLDFKVDSAPAHSGWEYQFSLSSRQTLSSPDDIVFFIFPANCVHEKRITRVFSLKNCIPVESFYATQVPERNMTKVLLVDRGEDLSQGISLEHYGLCCKETVGDYIYVHVFTQDLRGCPPGWHKIGQSCIQINTKSSMWNAARYTCRSEGTRLFVSSNDTHLDDVVRFFDFHSITHTSFFHCGVYSFYSRWTWVSGQALSPQFKLWGRNEPKGGVVCSSIAPYKDSGRWNVNGESCSSTLGHICEKRSLNGTCDAHWFPIKDRCFKTHKPNLQWQTGRETCTSKGGDLAVIDVEEIKEQLITHITTRMSIGLRKVGIWMWLNGVAVAKYHWREQPDKVRVGLCAMLMKIGDEPLKLRQIKCNVATGYLCQTNEENTAYRRPTQCSSQLFQRNASFAVDGNIATCFQTFREDNPWLRIELERPMLVLKVHLRNRQKCCMDNLVDAKVLLDGGKVSAVCKAYSNLKHTNDRLLLCAPSTLSNNVMILAEGKNKVLQLCEVAIGASESFAAVHGVLQEVWFEVPGTLTKLLADSNFPSRPDVVKTAWNFDMPYGYAFNYGQRATAYLAIPTSGYYEFYAACDDECEVSIDTVDMRHGMNGEYQERTVESDKKRIIKLKQGQWTGHNQWNKFSIQRSSPIMLSRCHMYSVEVLMKQSGGKDCLSVGMRLPNGSFERPIPRKRVYWIQPGTILVDFKVINQPQEINTVVGDQLSVKAVYKYCCHGVYCPGCYTKLMLHLLDKEVLVHPSLPMSCKDHFFNMSLDTLVQPGTYDIKVSYSFLDAFQNKTFGDKIGAVTVTARTMLQCDLAHDVCLWKNYGREGDEGWLMSAFVDPKTTAIVGDYIFVNRRQAAWLESDWISVDGIHQELGVCLSFLFNLPTKTASGLNVYLKYSSDKTQVWSLSGYQGSDWSHGQVTWNPSHKFKVIFEGLGTVESKLNVALDDIKLTTANCARMPLHSLPGYTCQGLDSFQCDSGHCIKRDFICDGDTNCLDESDERNCKCLSSEFTCPSGECLAANKLCDGTRNCKDGSDEVNCARECSGDYFACVTGECVKWSATCDKLGRNDCQDESDEPLVCGSHQCPLNRLGCSLIGKDTTLHEECEKKFRVTCNFENGLCGLTYNEDSDFHWSTGTGSTPTKWTGPKHDHSTLTTKGKYIFLEASDHLYGEKAALVSGLIKNGTPVCAQFWYHMNGKDIGNLNIYVKTNNTKDLVWNMSGHQGDIWLFGQVGVRHSQAFRVQLEGVRGNGIAGDLAVDDFVLTEGECSKVQDLEYPGCSFNLDRCRWQVYGNWRLNSLAPFPSLPTNWQNSSDGFLYLQHCAGAHSFSRRWCRGRLESPVIRKCDMWRCVKFWHFLGGTGLFLLSVSIQNGNKSHVLLETTKWAGKWSYVQLPLPVSESSIKVIIKGYVSSEETVLAVDDIIFSKDECEKVPWSGVQVDFIESGNFPTRAASRWKLDGTDTVVRLFGGAKYVLKEKKVLYLRDKESYAAVPATDFRKTNFSLACWVYLENTYGFTNILADWTSPLQFIFYVQKERLVVELRAAENARRLLYMTSRTEFPSNTWTHAVFTWNRFKREGNLFINGQWDATSKSTLSGDNIDLNPTNHSFHILSTEEYGYFSDIMVFKHPLTISEVYALYSPSRISCPVRQGTDRGTSTCCVFPFVYKQKIHHTCISEGNNLLWCSTTPNYDRDRKWASCSVEEDCGVFASSWCGWQSSHSTTKWKEETSKDMQQSADTVVEHLKLKDMQVSSLGEINYEANFPPDHDGQIVISNFPDLTAFTVCFWMRSNDSVAGGTPFWYRVRSRTSDMDVVGIGVVDYRGFYVYVAGIPSTKTSAAAVDGAWHHICLTWTSHLGLIKFYVDQKRLLGKNFAEGAIIPGGGTFFVGLNASEAAFNVGSSQFIGSISGMNIWDRAISPQDVVWMSQGCGVALRGTLKAWPQFKDAFVGTVGVKRPATCTDPEGTRFVMYSNTSDPLQQKATFTSPIFKRSQQDMLLCVRFRYLLIGQGRRTLRLYQQLTGEGDDRRLMWELISESNITEMTWKYGRVALPSVTKYQVSFEAELSSSPGLAALKGMSVSHGNCLSVPLHAQGGCGGNLTETSGVILSPYYPSYYPNLLHCVWRITVQSGHIVRLRFLSFELEYHPTCQNDHVTVYDVSSKSMIGRYCGRQYPEFVESTGPEVVVIFRSDARNTGMGFRANYTSEKRESFRSKFCFTYEGCPSDCNCNFITTKDQGAVVTAKRETNLRIMPGKLPSYTTALMLDRNSISHIPNNIFGSVDKIEYIDISNNVVFRVGKTAFQNLSSLNVIRLNSNLIKHIPGEMLTGLVNLQTLDLGKNLIEEVPEELLKTLVSLRTLSLRSNQIEYFEEKTFNWTSNLIHLYLQHNRINTITDFFFSRLKKLRVLHLNNNNIKRISSNTFQGLSALEKLYLQNNFPEDVDPDSFSDLISLQELHLDEFVFCCYAEKAIPGLKCSSPKDGFSSCADLMKNRTLQICVWILGLSALVGNAFVILFRIIFKEDNKVHSFLLTNLAIADLLMGVYLLIIAAKDIDSQGEYFKHDIQWRSGVVCQFAGVLSLLSSEVSVLMLTLITVDRLISIVFTFRFNRIKLKKARVLVALVWLIGVLLATIPVFGIDYFNDRKRRVGFYGRSSVCLPLQLSKEKLSGWEYAMAIFVVLNFLSFSFIFVAYVVIFYTVNKASSKVRSTKTSRESQMAKRLLFIVLTDFCCWMPVILISVLSMLGKFHDPEKQAYVWIATIVLPVNSSINPILYTFSTPLMKKLLEDKRKVFRRFLSRKIHCKVSTDNDKDVSMAVLQHTRLDPHGGKAIPSSASKLDTLCTSVRKLVLKDKNPDQKGNLDIAEASQNFPEET